LHQADLRRADLGGAILNYTDLRQANLSEANLSFASLDHANLCRANLSQANFTNTELCKTALREADLRGADLRLANLYRTRVAEADFGGARCYLTKFVHVDLSAAKGLDAISHDAPSAIGGDTLFLSKGKVAEAFLRGCGQSPWEVLSQGLYDPELTPASLAELQYKIFDAWTKGRSMINGCFVSYSWNDSGFVDRIRARLLDEGINVWLDRQDMVAGTIQDQVWRAIQIHHVVIIVLSQHSIESDWVENELEMARKKEKEETRAVLCPIALDDSWKLKVSAVDGPGDPSRHLWRTLQQKLVVDFSRWEADQFQKSFEKLLRGLKTNYGPQTAIGQKSASP
jgi:hypothetical protein